LNLKCKIYKGNKKTEKEKKKEKKKYEIGPRGKRFGPDQKQARDPLTSPEPLLPLSLLSPTDGGADLPA
jgi:hypothetical protein